MKKLLWILLIIVLIILGVWIIVREDKSTTTYVNTTGQATTTTDTGNNLLLKSFSSADGSISFSYPTLLTVAQQNNIITLHHQINFTNTDACNMKGTGTQSPTLTDFNVTMQTFNLTM